MPSVTTADGTQIFHEDWGEGRPVVLSQVVPVEVGGEASAERIKNSTFTVHPGAPHGVTDTHRLQLREDLLTSLGEKR